MNGNSRLPRILEQHENAILSDWLRNQLSAASRPNLKEPELREQSRQFLSHLRSAAQSGATNDVHGPAWSPMRDFLGDLSRNRARQGFAPAETANFVFSIKLPLFAQLRQEYSSDAGALADETLIATLLLDNLGLYTMECSQKGREEIIARQQKDLLELSTPVVKLWEGVLALPVIGTLDSARTQILMESLLQQIVDTGADIAIIDITGVPTVDTLVAQHLLKTIAAARLMGADCIISGIRPQIAQTIVHLGVGLGDVVTKATLADAFRLALRRQSMAVTRVESTRERVETPRE
jgi:rsbT co-antagonist protein RsbR